jgi:hypothetical protein
MGAGCRHPLEDGFSFGCHFGGFRRRSQRPTPVGGWFFLLKLLRWLSEGEPETDTRWRTVFPFEVASVIDEGGIRNQHLSGAGCFAKGRFGDLRRGKPKPTTSGNDSSLSRSLGNLRSRLRSAPTGRWLLLQRSLRRLAWRKLEAGTDWWCLVASCPAFG